ncbi:MAG TPA: hypothetical protein VEL31_21680 [Ktedonobacteraceae bacterium]|nr:hypothetical protein [Ktedonobacteraceae bacterium]
MRQASILSSLHQIYGKDAQWFPASSYRYLRGYTTSRRRGICLIGDAASNHVTKEAVLAAYEEVRCAGLITPFLFFGCSKLSSDDAYIFMQVTFEGPWIRFPRILYRS